MRGRKYVQQTSSNTGREELKWPHTYIVHVHTFVQVMCSLSLPYTLLFFATGLLSPCVSPFLFLWFLGSCRVFCPTMPFLTLLPTVAALWLHWLITAAVVWVSVCTFISKSVQSLNVFPNQVHVHVHTHYSSYLRYMAHNTPVGILAKSLPLNAHVDYQSSIESYTL